MTYLGISYDILKVLIPKLVNLYEIRQTLKNFINFQTNLTILVNKCIKSNKINVLFVKFYSFYRES